MRLFFGLIGLAVSLLVDNGVVVLKGDTFDDFIKPENNFITMLEFYAPWCGHCKQFAPVYEEIAKELEAKNPENPIRVAKIDATEPDLQPIAQRYGVSGYPTLKLVRDGEVMDWNGGRDKDEIVSTLIEQSDPEWAPPPEAVVTLTNDDFDEVVNQADFIVVEFYAPWCGHCKKLAPEWEAAAQELKKEGITLAKVDATEASELAEKFDVSGYPTIKIFRKGTPYEYSGGRDKHTIISYVLEQAGPPSILINSKKAYQNIIKKGTTKGPGVPVIGFFEDENDARLVKFADAANHIREEFQFYHVYGNTIEGTKAGTVRIVHQPHFQSKYEKKFLEKVIEDGDDAKEIQKWVEEHVLPLVGAVTKATRKYYEPLYPRCFVFYDVDFSHNHIKNTQIWRNKVLNVAVNKAKEGIIFAVADETENMDLVKRFNLQDSGEEINVGCVGKDKMFYPMPEDEFDEDVLEEFVDQLLAGKAKAYVKSEKVPKTQGDVVKVVGNNFKNIVLDDSKDVMIEFYAPWCGHCKNLAPIYDKLGASYKDDSNVVIAKMDATANDIPSPDYEASGFPTIYFKPAGKAPMKYEKGRALEDFTSFIAENSGLGGKDEL